MTYADTIRSALQELAYTGNTAERGDRAFCVACNEDWREGDRGHEPDCYIGAAFAFLDVLEADRARYQQALQGIAESYPWEPYDEDETIHKPRALITTGIPTNRRIARVALGETT